ncbi:MAG: hypothetical protein E7578_05645 [Ruminococcaceae bacterium]|nr:hypothetical protein [Oscillospiraceae bacterium]
MKTIGIIIILTLSVLVGFILSDNLRTRLKNITSLCSFVEYISENIRLYKTPLDEIFTSFSNEYLEKTGFIKGLETGLYNSAKNAGLLYGDEESIIIKTVSDKLGYGTVDEMDKLCSSAINKLKNLEDKLKKELPDKQKVYRTISVLAGASIVIMFI